MPQPHRIGYLVRQAKLFQHRADALHLAADDPILICRGGFSSRLLGCERGLKMMVQTRLQNSIKTEQRENQMTYDSMMLQRKQTSKGMFTTVD
eukprot:953362-Pelagomonas_calceolata.AAC.1